MCLPVKHSHELLRFECPEARQVISKRNTAVLLCDEGAAPWEETEVHGPRDDRGSMTPECGFS